MAIDVVLPEPLTPATSTTAGRASRIERRTRASQGLAEMVPQRAARVAVGEAARAGLLPDLLHERLGGVEPEIGLKEERLEILDRVALELLPLEDAREAILERGARLAEPVPEAIGKTRQELHGWTSRGMVASFTTWPADSSVELHATVELELHAARVPEGDAEAPGASPLTHSARGERLLDHRTVVRLDAHPGRVSRAHDQDAVRRLRSAGHGCGGRCRWR